MKTLEEIVAQHRAEWAARSLAQQQLEIANNEAVAKLYGLEDEVPSYVPLERVSLTNNSAFRWPNKSPEERDILFTQSAILDLLSYAVGCMFGRYSLDEPGLILASQGETLKDYLARVPNPSFMPDRDNVIPVTSGDWFDDNIEARFRQFLRIAFGKSNAHENLQFIEETLGKSIKQYFLKDFYADHVKRYKNRPIYWMFSSRPDGKGSFNALVYLHRYTPATLNALLNEYLREFQEKLRGTITSLDGSTDAAAKKRSDVLRPVLTECEDYERDVLYPLVLRNPQIDLDDGVLVNYLRFGRAVLRIRAIEDKRSDVEQWTWPVNPLRPEDA
ncbi:MAG: class I SAM-dependent DNA methyltransferase [Propionibacteriaceae bacterium]|jgi:hypothetical protein|nr:class I SAM-dependent DNA methyltransferase [Propionibacteriaceae bacterium]